MPCFSEAAREAFNDWAIGLFGGRKTSQFIVLTNERMIFAHPATVAALKEALA